MLFGMRFKDALPNSPVNLRYKVSGGMQRVLGTHPGGEGGRASKKLIKGKVCQVQEGTGYIVSQEKHRSTEQGGQSSVKMG